MVWTTGASQATGGCLTAIKRGLWAKATGDLTETGDSGRTLAVELDTSEGLLWLINVDNHDLANENSTISKILAAVREACGAPKCLSLAVASGDLNFAPRGEDPVRINFSKERTPEIGNKYVHIAQ